jgi:hypothetical protein
LQRTLALDQVRQCGGDVLGANRLFLLDLADYVVEKAQILGGHGVENFLLEAVQAVAGDHCLRRAVASA